MLNLYSAATVRELCRRHGFSLSKGLGQNFITSPHICPKIAENAGCLPGVPVLEIGPGFGVLTAELARRAANVTAIEADRRLLPVLAETLADFPNTEIIFGDALKLNLADIMQTRFPGQKWIICANLPYYITTPLIMRLLEGNLPVESITVMVQKEAATRLCALPGTRESGAISAAIRFYGRAKLLFDVKRTCFTPQPNIDSAVIAIQDIRQPDQVARDNYSRLVKCIFSQRRKQAASLIAREYRIAPDAVIGLLADIGAMKTARAEEFSFEQLCGLAQRISII